MINNNVLVISVAISLLGVTFALAFMVFRTLYHVERTRSSADERLLKAVQGIERLSDKVIDVASLKLHSMERATSSGPPPASVGINPFENIPLDGDELGPELDPSMVMNPTRG